MLHFLARPRRVLLAIALISTLAAALAWQRLAPTEVVLVNYPDFQATRIARADDSPWLKVRRRSLDELARADGAGLVLVFGRGLAMNDAQRAALQELASGTPVYVDASTDPASDVTNLKGTDLDAVAAYLASGGDHNYRALLGHVRRAMQGKPWGPRPEPAREIAQDVLFHLGDENVFTDLPAFERHARQAGLLKEGSPRVALLTSVPGPFNSNREHVDALIKVLAERGLNVYPVAAFSGRLELLRAISPDLVVYMPHGRLTLDQAEAAAAWLSERNIPVLTPLSVFQDAQAWREDPQGFSGPLLTMSLALPELDGGIAPYVVAAQTVDAAGYQIFTPIPERLSRFADLVDGFLALKRRPPKDQRIAIYYFKGPGMSALTAGDLEVAPSLHRLLLEMRAAGYDLGNLPSRFEDFSALLQRQGRVLAPYAAGDQAAFFKESDPARISVTQYRDWCRQAGIEANCAAIDAKFGPAPGRYLVDADGRLGVARLQFGKVAVLPQPLSGIGEDSFKLVHGTNAPPPHPYAASYLWARYGFRADAVMHFGTHGSLEFTPAKQVALSSADWADALVGGLPHFYVYTMSNVGEAIIAKRRSYATTLSHLTPPIREAGLHSQLRQLADALQAADHTDPAVAHEHRRRARSLADETGLAADLELPGGEWSAADWQRLTNHVERLRSERITMGLHTLGRPYADEELRDMLQLASAEAVAQALAELARHQGRLTDRDRDDERLLTERFREPARRMIAARLGGASLDAVLAPVVAAGERARLHQEARALAGPSDAELIRNFVGMARRTAPRKAETGEADPAQLQTWVVAALAVPEQREFLTSLSSDKNFERASKTLDPQQLERARTIARAIPPMARALEIATQPQIRELLQAMQSPATRKQVLALLDEDSLAERVRAEARRREAEVLAGLEARGDDLKALARLPDADDAALARLDATLREFARHGAIAARSAVRAVAELGHPQAVGAAQQQVAAELARRQERARRYREAVLGLESAVESAPQLEQGLRASARSELDAVLRALRGGYIPASPGGDPIVTPAAVPVGRNLYSVDAEKTPSAAAERVGAQLGQALIDAHRARHDGAYPRKVAFTLWPGDFIGTEGAVVAEIFWLLGVEPVRDAFQRVVSVRVIPAERLGRPRVDVVVQTAGQLRDLAASRLYLIEEAVRLAAAEPEPDNALAASRAATEARLKDAGYAPMEARRLAGSRVFGGLNGAYGTAIMGLVERGDRWQDAREIATTYLDNMGASYGSAERWMQNSPGLFAAALAGTDALVQPRDSNTWGALSLDHVYEFMGGLSRAIEQVNGRAADAYFDDFRQPQRPRVSTLEETLSIESRATVLNPEYLRGLAAGGASSAERLAEISRNAYGWEAMRPEAIPDRFWDELFETVVKDRERLGLRAFFERENPHALQEVTAVMLETARKGLWPASPEQIGELARLHADSVGRFGASCTDFTCGNTLLRPYIEAALNDERRAAYAAQVEERLTGGQSSQAMVLSKEASPNARAAPNSPEASSTPAPEVKHERALDPRWSVLLLLPVLIYLASRMRGRHGEK